MRRVHGEEVCALTRGGLPETRSALRNLFSDGQLNRQKSAEVVVPMWLETRREGPNL
ncbi:MULTISPECIES: hypothetical protein [Bacillaceae]|uniref:hypothetical protein n=1 Tax=Bacillaceae TaxID=186817 RepID=UPI0018FE31E4|nr:hypothetical protein [Virgibacillus senegalensis]